MWMREVFVCGIVVTSLCIGCEKGTQVRDTAASSEAVREPVQDTSSKDVEGTTSDERVDVIALPGGDVSVVALEHGSFFLVDDDRLLIAVDPTSDSLDHDRDVERGKADLVLITDIHGDHLDPEAVNQIRDSKTIVVAPQAVVDKAGERLGDVVVMANGEERSFFDGALGLRATPMYNIKRSPEGSDEPFHVKGRGNGYVLSLNGGKIYISGDTECTPEMKALEGIDAAFVTMNLPYTMPPEEAAECIRAFEPRLIYPFHYRGQDPSQLDELLGVDSGVQVRLLEWYPGQASDEAPSH